MQGKHSWLHFVNYLIYKSIPLTIINALKPLGTVLVVQSPTFSAGYSIVKKRASLQYQFAVLTSTSLSRSVENTI